MKRLIWGMFATVAILNVSGSARADVITFDTIPLGGITGPTTITEGDFDYTIVDGFGGVESGADLEYERLVLTAGDLTVTRTDGGHFDFSAVDLQLEYGGPNGSFTAEGFLNGSSVGTDAFLVSSFGYTTFNASNLAGVTVDELVINAERGFDAGIAVNNLVVNQQAVPEPATLTIFGLGALGIAGAAIRRRRKTA